MKPSHITWVLMSFTDCHLPFPHLTNGQKNFPCKDYAISSANHKKPHFFILWHFIKLYDMHEHLTFFLLKGWPYPIEEDIFLFLINTYGFFFSFVKFDKISAAFCIGLQVHEMKVVPCHHPPRSSMHSENKLKCNIPQFCQILQKTINSYVWINYKK